MPTPRMRSTPPHRSPVELSAVSEPDAQHARHISSAPAGRRQGRRHRTARGHAGRRDVHATARGAAGAPLPLGGCTWLAHAVGKAISSPRPHV